MTEINTLDVVERQDVGKGASRRLRRLNDLVPAIVYGTGKPPVNISIEQRHLRKALMDEGFYSRILTLNIGSQAEKVVLKDVQRHPYKPVILHVDFLRVSAHEKITMHVPIHFTGEEEAPGIKEGGVLSKEIIEAEITCLPADLPEFLSMDISDMEMDQSRHLSDLALPSGVELVQLSKGHDNDMPIASLHRPKVVVEEEPVAEEDVAAEGEEGAEGEASADQGKADGASDQGSDEADKK